MSYLIVRIFFAFRNKHNLLPKITSEYYLKVFWLIYVHIISCMRKNLCVHVAYTLVTVCAICWALEMGVCHFYYFTVQSHLLCVWQNQSFLYYFSVLQSFELAMQDSHPSLYSIIISYHLCISEPFW